MTNTKLRGAMDKATASLERACRAPSEKTIRSARDKFRALEDSRAEASLLTPTASGQRPGPDVCALAAGVRRDLDHVLATPGHLERAADSDAEARVLARTLALIRTNLLVGSTMWETLRERLGEN